MPSTIPGTWETTLSPALVAHQRTVSAPRLAPDGRTLAFAGERDGRTDLFVVGEEAWPRQVTADHALSGGSYGWSPDGRQFALTAAADGKLWLCPSSGGPARRLAWREGRHHTPRFSPDGRFVSFVCDRGDEIDVVVVSVDGTWQRVLNRGSDFPMDPSWSPDGRRLVWHAYPNTVMPWDQSTLVVAEVDGGEPRTIASAPRTAYANARFSPDGTRIVCVCDRGGALNVTEMGVDGSGQTTLHEDRWEHGEPSYSPDGQRIVYTRNVDGDYTLWTVASGGGGARPVTDVPGRAGSPSWSPDGRSVVYTHESPVAPPEVWEVEVASGRTKRRTFVGMGGIEASELVLPEHVSWTSADGFEVHGLLYAPKEVQPGRHGCLVEIHGGPMNQSRVVWNGLIQYLVQRGWVLVQPNYRGTLGYGRAYREALFGSWGKGDLEDYLGGIDLCERRGLIRSDRVVAWGGSAGGYSTLLCLTGAPERFAAGVALFGLYDLYAFGLETHRYERYYVETILGGSADNYPLWYERSPLNFVDRMRAPILLLHGERDPAALPAQSETLIRELQRHRIDYEYAYYPGEGHGFRKISTIVDYVQRMDRFLCQKVLRAPLPGPLGTLPYPPMPMPRS
ncbi:MAG TPA: S9 family peptidase [Thermomicrobiales bacterium]